MEAKERLICALDVDNAYCALQLVSLLQESVGVFKVGLELLTTAGVQIVEKLRDAGAERIFFDAKLHDIPNTVAGAMRGVVRQEAWCVTVHAAGGAAMLRAATEAARQESEKRGLPRPRVLAVTLLTSLSAEELRAELRVDLSLSDYVRSMAQLAQETGCDGVITSPREIQTLRAAIPDPNFLVVTPGVRPLGAERGDQARVMTPAEAIRHGASMLVVGRPIVAAPDPADAARRIIAEIANAGI